MPVVEGPQGFIGQVVDRLNAGDSAGWGVPNTTAWYDATWLQLMSDNNSLSRQFNVESLVDLVPICACLRGGGRYRVLTTSMNADGTALARLRLTAAGQTTDYGVVLRVTPTGWRIFDTVNGSLGMRAFLTQHVACLRSARSRSAAELCEVG